MMCVDDSRCTILAAASLLVGTTSVAFLVSPSLFAFTMRPDQLFSEPLSGEGLISQDLCIQLAIIDDDQCHALLPFQCI